MKEQTVTQLQELLKKFWFVILVACIFIGFSIYFAWDTNKDKIPGKTIDGKDVIFSSDQTNYTADEYYKALFNKETEDTKNGVQQLYNLLEKEVITQTGEATEEMEENAALLAEQMQTEGKQSYGDSYETLIGSQLVALGYEGIEDLEEFYINMNKLNDLISKHIEKNLSLFDEVYKKEAPREITHILVQVDDSATAEDKKAAEDKKTEIKKALDDGEKFTKVAKKYSDDPGSKESGGKLGMQLKSANLVEAFKKAAWELKEGQVSDWIKTEYGYHLIWIETTDKEKMLKNETNEAAIQSAIVANYPNLTKEIIWKQAKKLGIEIKDKELKKELLAFIGVKK